MRLAVVWQELQAGRAQVEPRQEQRCHALHDIAQHQMPRLLLHRLDPPSQRLHRQPRANLAQQPVHRRLELLQTCQFPFNAHPCSLSVKRTALPSPLSIPFDASL